MMEIIRAAVVLTLAAAAVCIGGGESKADTWKVCNATSERVFVSIAYNLKDQRQYISSGWWSLAPQGGCETVLSGNLPIRGVFLRGEAGPEKWEGETLFCVLRKGDLPGANLLDEKACAAKGGSEKAYQMHTLTAADNTTTLRHGPGAPRPPGPQGFGNDVQGCAVDKPCFQAAYQQGDNVVFEFNGVTGWDYYNVRLPDGEQFENRSGHFTLHDVKQGHTYQISVEGCHKNPLAPSHCTEWVDQKFTAK